MLQICEVFFDYLNLHKIRYCHWKSNSAIQKSLTGRTDLDVLIHREDKDKFLDAIKQHDIKKIISPPDKTFPNLEDYLGFDNETGKFIHLHVHYDLILGQKFIKNHHLPIEDLFFDNLILEGNVYMPCPELELMLLVIRANMKVDLLGLLKHAIKDITSDNYTAYPRDIETELAQLIESSDKGKLFDLLAKSNLPLPESLFTNCIRKFSKNRLKAFDIFILQRQILKGLRAYRRDTGVKVEIKYLFLLLRNLPLITALFKPGKKTLTDTGKIISIVGADGSGKSTLVGDITNWLSWKLSVREYYYGIPKSRFNKLMFFVIRIADKFKLAVIRDLFECYLWTRIAKNRAAINKQTFIDRCQNHLVVTDRFPLNDFQKMKEPMDGPRLNPGQNKLMEKCSESEKKYYDSLAMPDLVFVLKADVDVLRKRKTDLSYDTHSAKATAVNALPAAPGFIFVDVSQDYPTVLLEIQREIWKLI